MRYAHTYDEYWRVCVYAQRLLICGRYHNKPLHTFSHSERRRRRGSDGILRKTTMFDAVHPKPIRRWLFRQQYVPGPAIIATAQTTKTTRYVYLYTYIVIYYAHYTRHITKMTSVTKLRTTRSHEHTQTPLVLSPLAMDSIPTYVIVCDT